MDDVLSVPYFSQWSDPDYNAAVISGADPCSDPTWRSSGFAEQEDYRFWSNRVCGLACLKSILSAFGMEVPTTAALLDRALTFGAYRLRSDGVVDGLIYEPFSRMIAHDFGLASTIITKSSCQQLPSLVPRDGVIVWSVSSEIRNPFQPNARKGGHLVLILGANDRICVFHNPSGVYPYQKWAVVPTETLSRFSANRGIIIERSVS